MQYDLESQGGIQMATYIGSGSIYVGQIPRIKLFINLAIVTSLALALASVDMKHSEFIYSLFIQDLWFESVFFGLK